MGRPSRRPPFRETEGPTPTGCLSPACASILRFAAIAIGTQLVSALVPLAIFGVVADTRTDDLSTTPEPEIYLPFWIPARSRLSSCAPPASRPPSPPWYVAQLRTVDPTSAVERITTMAELRRESVASRTFAMRLLIGFAVVATLLAVVGLYGVLSLSVNSRIKEMAVRKAVGAQSRQIIQLVVVEGSRMVLAGLVIGAMVAVLVGRLLKTLLFDVKPSDPMALGIAAIAFAAVAIAAGLLPAYRASRVELMEALRQE